ELDLVEHLAGLLIPLDVVNVAVLHLPLDGLAHRPGQVLEPDVVASQRWQGERQRQTGCRDGDRSFHAGNLLLEIDLQTARLERPSSSERRAHRIPSARRSAAVRHHAAPQTTRGRRITPTSFADGEAAGPV